MSSPDESNESTKSSRSSPDESNESTKSSHSSPDESIKSSHSSPDESNESTKSSHSTVKAPSRGGDDFFFKKLRFFKSPQTLAR